MSIKHYQDELHIEAIKQVTNRGYSLVDVTKRLDITTHSLCLMCLLLYYLQARRFNLSGINFTPLAIKRTAKVTLQSACLELQYVVGSIFCPRRY